MDNNYNTMIPNYFMIKNDVINYKYDNVTYEICVIQKGQRRGSVIQMIESGLNHMLEYYYYTNEDKYNEICTELYKTYINIHGFLADVKSKEGGVYARRQQMIDKFCYPSKILANAIIYYVIDLSDCDIDEKDATTDVTITNMSATAMEILTFYFKVLELFSEMNPEKSTKTASEHKQRKIYEKLLDRCADDIVKFCTDNDEVYKKFKEIFTDDKLSARNIKNEFYSFISDRAAVLWDQNATPGYTEKYLEVGFENSWNEDVAINNIFGACKKFSAPLASKSLLSKYINNPLYKDIEKPVSESRIFYKMGADYRDFRFVKSQIVSFCQHILEQTNDSFTRTKSIPDINVTQILNADTESIRKQDSALQEDSKVSLYDMRVEFSHYLFRELMIELRSVVKSYKIEHVLKLSNDFNLSKSHRLNNYILAKIFLSLNGEKDIYKDIFGVYSKLFLTLFYIRINTIDTYKKYRPVIECMRMLPTIVAGDSLKDNINEFINNNNIDSRLSQSLQNICRGYLSADSASTSFIDVADFWDFFLFMKDPNRVRHVMFPSKYSETKECSEDTINPEKLEVVKKCMELI